MDSWLIRFDTPAHRCALAGSGLYRLRNMHLAVNTHVDAALGHQLQRFRIQHVFDGVDTHCQPMVSTK